MQKPLILPLFQRSVLFRPCGSTKFDSEYDGYRSEYSPAESFVSAQDDGWELIILILLVTCGLSTFYDFLLIFNINWFL